jgi:hypothetical protein
MIMSLPEPPTLKERVTFEIGSRDDKVNNDFWSMIKENPRNSMPENPYKASPIPKSSNHMSLSDDEEFL